MRILFCFIAIGITFNSFSQKNVEKKYIPVSDSLRFGSVMGLIQYGVDSLAGKNLKLDDVITVKKFPSGNMTYAAALKAGDRNKDKSLQLSELVALTQEGLFMMYCRRGIAVVNLLEKDLTQDGYIANNELKLSPGFVDAVDSAAFHSKYKLNNGEMVIDYKGRRRATGAARIDGRLSVSELANAFAEKKLMAGAVLYWVE